MVEERVKPTQLVMPFQTGIRASLIENVQFIYELALAQLELEALGIEFDVTNGLREFVLKQADDMDTLLKRPAYFKSIGGTETDYYQIIKYNRTRSVNQYLTHWIYPYKGKFHPQMIRALLNILKLKKGDTVMDPYGGSGTTAVEAQLLGINCVGFDISPLCVLQSKVKTQSVYVVDDIESLQEEAIAAFRKSASLFKQNDSKTSYADFLASISEPRVRDFYLMAQLVAISDQARRGRNLEESFVRNLRLMVLSVEDYKTVRDKLGLDLGDVRIESGDARNLPLEDESVDGIITSPPYSIALDYVANDAHALHALGYDLTEMREQFIGVRGKGDTRVKLYNQDLLRSLKEMYRVLKPGGYCAIVIGNATYAGQEVKTIEFTIDQCIRIGFRLLNNINKIIFGLYNVMQTDNTLIFQKEE